MIENREIAVRLTDVSKQYRLGQIGGGTLQGDLQSWWAKVRGKEDPNSVIGSKKRKVGQTFMALNGVNLTIYKGEALGIIGGNGAGKSTMLKLLSRVTAPSAGKIQLYGRITSMLEVGTGFNPQMTGRENIYMNGAILGMTKEEIDEKMEDIIDFSEVREFIDTPVKRYSSGMFVKLAFSVAAHLDSEIMIMDEVLAVGDMAFQKKCLDKMSAAAKQEGRTVLYVSHNMQTIRQLCSRCIVLSEGQIIFDGDVEEAIQVYMGSKEDLRSEYIYSEEYHKNPRSNERLWMSSLRLIDRKVPACEYGEKIPLELTVRTAESWKDVHFRLELKYADDSLIGIAFTGSGVDFSAGEEKTVYLSIDTSHLAWGKYTADIVAYCYNSYGQEEYIDGVYPALNFEVQERLSEEIRINWSHQYWGHVRLHDMELTEVKPMLPGREQK